MPVGADWTDTRHILGYRNPFGPPRQVGGVETHETYQLEEPLRLLLRAAHPQREHIPHLLLLDEMNLSHVERYFSPFLSLMESGRTEEGQGVPLISADNIALISDVLEHVEPGSSEAEAAQHLKTAGRGLTLPPNVFIIGTINVDETTYMFSPKVLDRAQVIEILSVPPKVYLDPSHTETELTLSGAAALAVLRPLAPTSLKTRPNQAFLTRAQELGFPDHWASDVSKTVEYVLQKAYEVLEQVGFAFGYRLVNEVFAYLEVWILAQKEQCDETGQALSTDGWHDALDKVFSQKVLPKIHGNRRQLNDSLTKLETFLRGLSTQGVPNLGTPDPMPVSRQKLERMNRRLNATGYTTFVE
ncbi:hypothetical protein [Deinococcus peraridilitoris]|uniref:hypothetical protein n=1 Tax=Deinococcus peraridilitoris TaxID=432329 RepID=UPI0002FFC6DA|nr:hypothetical protein [Deinococcus peraridilitoris]